MNINEENVSEKSQIKALILCLLLGRNGPHRFYVGKYISGFLLFIVSGTSIILKIFGAGYALQLNKIVCILFNCMRNVQFNIGFMQNNFFS